MCATTNSSNEKVHIEGEGDAERQYILHDGNDAFVRTGKQIIEGCQLSISIEVWLEELHDMFGQVKAWCGQRESKIESCLAIGRGSKVLLFFIPHGTRFNFDLADELAELNRELVTSLNIGMVEIGQIPRSEVERFLAPEAAKLIYGRPFETSRTVEA